MEEVTETPMPLARKRKAPKASVAKKAKIAAKKAVIKSNIKEHKMILQKSEKVVNNEKKIISKLNDKLKKK
jgi:hypothetical protein